MKVESLKEGFYYKIILVLGLVASILWIMLVDTKPFSDFKYYYNLAVDIANGLPWGDTYTSVGYSIVLGGIFKLFGASLIKAKIFNIILTLISNICFLSILDKLDINEKTRKIVFALFVFMPNNIFYNSIAATEILFTAILLLITNIYFSKVKYKHIYIGVLTGVNTIIKPFFILFAIAIFLVDLLKEKRILKSIQSSLIVLVACILVISPWIYRNTKLIGQFTYVSNNGGIVLYINNNSQNKLGGWMPAANVENSLVKTEKYKNANVTERNIMLSDAAKQWIKNHPVEFIQLGFKRLFYTYLVGNDILYATNDSGLSHNVEIILCIIISIAKVMIFIPAIIYIITYSNLIIKSIIANKTETLNKFDIYAVVLFYMFTAIYFVAEGQARYAFPEIFIMVYCFFEFVKPIILKNKVMRGSSCSILTKNI